MKVAEDCLTPTKVLAPQPEHPTLDQLAAKPEMAARLPGAIRSQLIIRCAAVLAALSSSALTVATDLAPAPTTEPPENEEQLLTAAKVSEMLGLARCYVYELCRRGDLRSVRTGKYVRIPSSAVKEWIQAHECRGIDTALTVDADYGRRESGKKGY